LLDTFWPSSRSLSAFGLLLAAACTLVCTSRSGRAVVVMLATCQVCVLVMRYGDRAIQQSSDVAVAQQIILQAEQSAPKQASPQIALATSWRSTGTLPKGPYDFGISMFSTQWSSVALLRYVSGNRVGVSLADPQQCEPFTTHLHFENTGSNLLVCFDN
jgi:hypothetical protein